MYSYVYMIECVNGSYYTGWTNDPVRRMKAHLSGRGAKYTRAHPPVRMAHLERCRTRSRALRREAEIKAFTRRQKEALVRSKPIALCTAINDNIFRRYQSMSELKFYRCEHCKNVIVKVHDGGPVPVCCGEPMKELTANTTEASQEKHLPVVTRENGKITVTVGAVEHPMTAEHYIEFIALETAKGFRIAYLNPGDHPAVDFYEDEPVTAVYAYCNLHGLWKTAA